MRRPSGLLREFCCLYCCGCSPGISIGFYISDSSWMGYVIGGLMILGRLERCYTGRNGVGIFRGVLESNNDWLWW